MRNGAESETEEERRCDRLATADAAFQDPATRDRPRWLDRASFKDIMTVADVYQYPTQHYDHHRRQLTTSCALGT
ncbi:MAG TPA: hypothetical protein VGK49_06885 [Ilumatobacteraceae bacterium]